MKYFIANWKMNMNFESIYDWLQRWQAKEIPQNAKVLIAPSYLHLALVRESGLTNIELCGQNVSHMDRGAHTGEVGAFQLKELADYCIVGHSETNEPYALVMEKAKKCLARDIVPIICFSDAKKAKEYFLPDAMLAWEDPQNISKDGQYAPKNPEEIKKGIVTIRSQISANLKLVYGGSVNSNNADIVQLDELDGVLVGNASTNAEHFYEIIAKSKL